MSGKHAPQLLRLFDLPLGSRFRYVGNDKRTYVLLDYGGNGLVGDAPSSGGNRVFQGMYSAAESRSEFEGMTVEFVPVVESAQRDELLDFVTSYLEDYNSEDGMFGSKYYAKRAAELIAKAEGSE